MNVNEKVEKIKQLVLIHEYAAYMGYHVIPKGKYYTLEEHDSVMINPVTNRFFRNSSTEEYAKGSVINFAMYFGNMDYNQAVKHLTDYIGAGQLNQMHYIKPIQQKKQEKSMVLLPPHGGSRRHVYAYLNKNRCIDKFVIDYFFASNHLFEDDKHNCVFVSYDEEKNLPDFACKRGTYSNVPFKGDVEGCNYSYCFRLPAREGKRLYVCESVIDLMSLMTFFLAGYDEKKKMAGYHYQALAGTEKYMAIFNYIDIHPEIMDVYIAFDHDRAGMEAYQAVITYAEKKKYTQNFHPYFPILEGTDWNDVVRTKGDD